LKRTAAERQASMKKRKKKKKDIRAKRVFGRKRGESDFLRLGVKPE